MHRQRTTNPCTASRPLLRKRSANGKRNSKPSRTCKSCATACSGRARPHHVGSTYGKDNAEWIFARFKSWGLDTHIQQYDVLFPTPKTRVVELIEPIRYIATLQEPVVASDPTSDQQSEQLPSYNAYSIDGDVTAPLST